MDIWRLKLSKKEQKKIPKKELILFLQLSTIVSDINITRKILIKCARDASKIENGTLVDAAHQVMMNVTYTMCSKILSAWDLINTTRRATKWFKMEYKAKLDTNGLICLEKIESYFLNPKNNIKQIRIKFGDHSDAGAMEESFAKAGNDYEIFIPFSKSKSPFSELESEQIFTNTHFFIAYGIKNLKTEVIPELVDFGSYFSHLTLNYALIIYNKYSVKISPDIVKVPDPTSNDDVFNNFFKASYPPKKILRYAKSGLGPDFSFIQNLI